MHGIYQRTALRSLSTVYLEFLPISYNTATQPTLMLPLHLLHLFDKLIIVYQVSPQGPIVTREQEKNTYPDPGARLPYRPDLPARPLPLARLH
jgi:hypothetical protein